MGRISPCWASSFARGGKGTKTPPGTAAGKAQKKFPAGGIFSALLCRLSPDPYYGRAGGLALISARKLCERSHRLLLRKMEKILRGKSNTARLDGGKD